MFKGRSKKFRVAEDLGGKVEIFWIGEREFRARWGHSAPLLQTEELSGDPNREAT